jgi:hypothetical protein
MTAFIQCGNPPREAICWRILLWRKVSKSGCVSVVANSKNLLADVVVWCLPSLHICMNVPSAPRRLRCLAELGTLRSPRSFIHSLNYLHMHLVATLRRWCAAFGTMCVWHKWRCQLLLLDPIVLGYFCFCTARESCRPSASTPLFPASADLEALNLWAPRRHRAREKAQPHLVSVSFICFLGFEGVFIYIYI